MAYCDFSDLFAYGVSRGTLRATAREVASVNVTQNWFELGDHGLVSGDSVTFRAETWGSLPSPIVSGTEYYALVVSDSAFRVSLTAGGAAVDLSGAYSGVLVTAKLPEAAIRDWASRVIDDMLPQHVVPLTAPYPEIVRMTCAELSAGRLLAMTGQASTSLADVTKEAQLRLARWAKGAPIRGTNAPSSAGLATSASATRRDPSGWRTYGGL